MSLTTYIVVTPAFVKRVTHYATACRVAASLERNARNRHGAQAGADCYLVADQGGNLKFRGLIMGRTTIGKNFGCGNSVVTEARDFAALGVERAYRSIERTADGYRRALVPA